MTLEQLQQMNPKELYEYQQKNRETMQAKRNKARKSKDVLHKYIEIGQLMANDLYPGGLDLSKDEDQLSDQLVKFLYGSH